MQNKQVVYTISSLTYTEQETFLETGGDALNGGGGK